MSVNRKSVNIVVINLHYTTPILGFMGTSIILISVTYYFDYLLWNIIICILMANILQQLIIFLVML